MKESLDKSENLIIPFVAGSQLNNLNSRFVILTSIHFLLKHFGSQRC